MSEETLIQKLRYYSVDKIPRACETLMHQAADEIERLRSALEWYASWLPYINNAESPLDPPKMVILQDCGLKAREALRPDEEGKK